MSAAHHHHPEPKLSHNQSKILACLRKTGEPMSAYAILDVVRKAGISHPPTVYRALNDLMRKGMVHRLQSRSAFVACGQAGLIVVDTIQIGVEEQGPPQEVFSNPRSARFRQFLEGTLK